MHVLHQMRVETGMILEKLIGCARLAQDLVGHRLEDRVAKSGPVTHTGAGSPWARDILRSSDPQILACHLRVAGSSYQSRLHRRHQAPFSLSASTRHGARAEG